MVPPKTPTLLAPGVLIDRKYKLVRQIGEGAMGVVWSAVNVATSREVALKLIHRPEAEFRLRLQREARNCGALRHRNVVDIYDMGETEAGEPFLVMQLLTGETVAELLARRRRLDQGVAALIGRDVARGLAAAHAMHIIHRDLKPANIFLHREADVEEPVVKVLDFGVAKNLSVNDGLHTVVGGAVGSPLYMSPEQVRAEANVDHRADIWALGVVLFEMLTGMRPFQGDAQAVFTGILSGEIPTVAKYVRRVDQGLVDLVARCMRRERAERFGSAAEVAALLDRYAARGSSPSLRQTSPDGQELPGGGAEGRASLASQGQPGSGGAGFSAPGSGSAGLSTPGSGGASLSAPGAGSGGANLAAPGTGSASLSAPGAAAGGASPVAPGAGGASLSAPGAAAGGASPVAPGAGGVSLSAPGAAVGGASGGAPSAVLGAVGAGVPSAGAPGVGVLPAALQGGGPRALMGQARAAQGRPSHHETNPVGAVGSAMGPSRASAPEQPAGAAPPRAGSSGALAALPVSGGAPWGEDMPTLPITRASAEAAWHATVPRPAAGLPAAAVVTPLPSAVGAASTAPALASASGAQPAPAQPAPMAVPDSPWGGTVRMPMPQMPDRPPGAGDGAAVVAPAGSFGAPPVGMMGSTVKLDADASASAGVADSSMSASVPQQTGSSSTTPLVANSPPPLASQTGAHAAQGRQELAPQGAGQKRQKVAAVLAIAATAVALVLTGMFIAMRSGADGHAASAPGPHEGTPPLENSAPMGIDPKPQAVEAPRQPPEAPPVRPAEAPASAAPAEAPPGASASAAPAEAPPGASASVAMTAPGAAPVDRSGAAPDSGLEAGRPPEAAPGTKPQKPPASGASQSSKPKPANPCAHLTAFLRKNCEAKLKK